MSEPKLIPIDEAPEWVQDIVDQELVFLEEFAEANKAGNQVYRAIKADKGSFLIVFDQETGEPTDIVWMTINPAYVRCHVWCAVALHQNALM